MSDRTRTITWQDPAPGTLEGLSMPGIDYLHAVMKGELPAPPIAATLQFGLVEAEVGRAVFTCTPDESVYDPIGAVHGGLVCHAAAGQGLHVGRDQGQLSQGGAREQHPVGLRPLTR